MNLYIDGSTANVSHSQSNLSSGSKSKEPKMWYEQQVLTYFEFPKTLQKKREDIPENKNIQGKYLKCGKKYSGRPFSTSNWQRHLKVSCISLLYMMTTL